MISGIILAGGQSRRMKQDKAELPFHQHTMLEEMILKLKQVGIEDIMVSGHSSHQKTITDDYPMCGPLGGIHACMKHAQNASCLVISVDVPLVPISALKDLIDLHEHNHHEATILIHNECIEPLIGIYNTHLVKPIEVLLQEKRLAVKNLLSQIDYQIYNYQGDEALLTNCNTPADYQFVIQLSQSRNKD
ncbi:MAG: molybdenum cofactor guanylyltransferase [Erysipelotrichaceae bacterium]|nr:molybdenum cofactor guanylyltransferase [Erysipelotrichaceae bacterium]